MHEAQDLECKNPKELQSENINPPGNILGLTGLWGGLMDPVNFRVVSNNLG